MHRVVVVGAGLAGARSAEALRKEGYTGSITVIGDESVPPYLRPKLSKEFMRGEMGADAVLVHPPAWFVEHDVDLQLGKTVRSLHIAEHEVDVDGSGLAYDVLVLATGARPRKLQIPGSEHALYLRTLQDAQRLFEVLQPGKRLVLIGAGWIGLEIAAAARHHDVEVDLLEVGDLPLQRILGTRIAHAYVDVHLAHGVRLHAQAQARAIRVEDGRVASVELADGQDLLADTVVVGIGVQPNVELAQQAGLQVENGILVDERLRTSAPDVFAVGDVANLWHPVLQRRIRSEHWANAMFQPAIVAKQITGTDAIFDRQPYVYSDQYDLYMEYVGHVAPEHVNDMEVRGDVGARKFIVFWREHGRVVAAMHVNMQGSVKALRALIDSRREIDPSRLRDESVPLDEI